MHVIAAELRAAPGRREELLALCRRMLAPSRAEEGCLSYRFFVDPDDPERVLFFEEWRDRAAIDRHFATPHFRDFQARTADLIDAEPVLRIYRAEPEPAA
ncbi:MAG: antibiotic biosynthesis monooxygenase [Planctomycetota bacterium]|nr:MAG: antibiotic biosynthesis monooxygenase [Planctomycetota bacterium]